MHDNDSKKDSKIVYTVISEGARKSHNGHTQIHVNVNGKRVAKAVTAIKLASDGFKHLGPSAREAAEAFKDLARTVQPILPVPPASFPPPTVTVERKPRSLWLRILWPKWMRAVWRRCIARYSPLCYIHSPFESYGYALLITRKKAVVWFPGRGLATTSPDQFHNCSHTGNY